MKSSVEFKDHYLYDVAIQHHVLRGCGTDIASSCLMHLNREYVYGGQQHDLSRLFTIKNLTKRIEKVERNLPKLLKAQQRVLEQDAPPDIAPGDHCLHPYTCEFFDQCNPAVPKDHVSRLPRLSEAATRELLDRGITQIQRVLEDFPLTVIQDRVRSAVSTCVPWTSGNLTEELVQAGVPPLLHGF